MVRRGSWVLAGCLGLAAQALAADARGADAAALRAIEGAASYRVGAEAPEIGAANEKPSLAGFLDEEGRLAVPAGFNGSLDPHGFELMSNPGEPPRFAAKNAVDEDARWDPQFGQAIGCDGSVRAMASFSDGRIVLGGDFTLCGNVPVDGVAIWNPQSGVFQALGMGAATGVSGSVRALAVGGADVYVGGTFSEIGGVTANNVARFNAVTQTWSPLGTGAANGVNQTVWALATAGSDVYVGGDFNLAGGTATNFVARFNTGTAIWSPLGTGAANGVSNSFFVARVLALAIAGSEVYVGGSFTHGGGAAANNVARFNTSTQVWNSLGNGVANGTIDAVRAIAVAGSEVYVGGDFTQAGGATANFVARFNNTAQSWLTLGEGAQNGVSDITGYAPVHEISIAGSEVYIGGSFTHAGGATANNVARFNAGSQAWSPLGTGTANGVGGSIDGLAVAGSEIYVGGFFVAAGGVTANRMARFNTSSQSWAPLGTGAANGVGGGFSIVNALAIADGNIFAGGSFTRIGGVTANNIARFNTGTGTWSALGSGAANGVSGGVRAIEIFGSDVYVGGSFFLAGGATANRVARFSTSTQVWSPLGTGVANGVNGDVNALKIAGSNVYVGGHFSLAGSAAANNVASFSTSTETWAPLGTGAQNGVNGSVYALAIAGSDVYVGGSFNQAGAATANRVARFNTTMQTWSSLGTGAANGVVGSFQTVYALAIAGSDILVGGEFTHAGGNPANNVARYRGNSQTWASLGSGATNGVTGSEFDNVYALASAGNEVYVGGFFTVAGGVSANRVARFITSNNSWSPLGSGTANGANDYVTALAVACTDALGSPAVCDVDGRAQSLLLGGDFTRAGPNFSLRIARYDNRRSTTSVVSASVGPQVPVNSSVTFSASIAATVFPALPGAVQFLGNGAVIGTCANQPLIGGLDTRTATCTTAALPIGAYSIVARYQGDALNLIGTSDPVAISILPPAFEYNLSALPSTTFNAAGYTSGTIAVATASGSGVIPPVSFQVVDAGLLPPGLTAAPQPNGLLITGTPTQAGSFTFTVRATDSSSATVGGPFSGDRQYTIVVARATQAITPITRVDAVPLDNGVAFADGNFAVQANASSGLPVVIDSTTPTVCQIGAPGSTVQPLQIGTCTLRARQAGNANYEPATEVLRTFQVKATPDVFVSSAPNPSVFPFGAAAPDPVVLSATVETPGTATPAGTVRFLRTGNTIAGCAAQPLSGTGTTATATCTTSSLTRGANTLTAQYSGDALNVLATSNAATHQLNVGTSSGIATITPSPCVVGQGCTVAVAVAAASGTPTGSVQVGSSTGGSCTITLAAGGGSCALTATTPGSGTVSATYLGSPPWLASPAATQVHPFVATVDELFVNGFEPVVAAPTPQ